MRFVAVLLALSLIAAEAQAQVVQQPVVRNFGYAGSALVPDSGTAVLGGNLGRQSSSVSRGFGPFGRRTAGNSLGGRSMSVSVTIIDLNALDEALLNAPISDKPETAPKINAGPLAPKQPLTMAPRIVGAPRKILSVGQPNDLPTGITATDSNAYTRALVGHKLGFQPAAVKSLREDDVRYYIEEGQKAEKAGRIVSARVYYRMAMDSLTPDIVARYEKILAKKKEDAKKKNSPSNIRF